MCGADAKALGRGERPTHRRRRLYWTIGCVCLPTLLAAFVWDRCRTVTPQTYPPLGDAIVIKKLEDKLHLDLPDDVALIATSDGGGREPQRKFYLWLLCSRSGFALTPDMVPRAGVFWPDADPTETARLIQPYLPKGRLPQGTEASALSWEAGGLDFDASLLRTEKGDFLRVTQIRSRRPAAAPQTSPASEPRREKPKEAGEARSLNDEATEANDAVRNDRRPGR